MLRSRVVTALALALLLVLAILFSPPNITAAILGVILLIGAWEWSAFLAVSVRWRVLYVLLLLLTGVAGVYWTLELKHFVWTVSIASAWWVLALLWIVGAPQRVGRVVAALAGALALLPTWFALVHIDTLWHNGAQWTLFILALSFAADTGAFFAGRQFGRLPLAPRVSPNKTWEGVMGGMLLALAAAACGAAWFRLAPLSFVPLCLAAAGFSVIGDLTESLLKRHVHLKDSGRLFPGHGGVLDRIDSVTAATPVMALGLIWLGVGALATSAWWCSARPEPWAAARWMFWRCIAIAFAWSRWPRAAMSSSCWRSAGVSSRIGQPWSPRRRRRRWSSNCARAAAARAWSRAPRRSHNRRRRP